MYKKRLLVLMMAMVMVFTACSSGANGAVATVDGVDISQEKFDTYYLLQRMDLVEQAGEDFLEEKVEGDQFKRTYGEMVREDILDMLISQQVVLNAAEELGIDVKDQLNSEMAEMKEYAGEEYFNEMLDELGITEEEYFMVIEDSMIQGEYREKLMEDVEVTDEEIEAYYEENKEALNQVQASHILVETEEEALNVLQRLEEGEDFAELAQELSQDPGSAINGGDLGFFQKDMMVEPFGDVAYDQEIGEISEPVETDFGFHIIKTTAKNESVEDVRDEIAEMLKAESVEETIQQMEKDAKVKKHIDLKVEPESIKERIADTTEEVEATENDMEETEAEDTTEEIEEVEEDEKDEE